MGELELGSSSRGVRARNVTKSSAGVWGSSGLFSPSAVAEQLIARGQVQVPIGKAKYKLKISPYMRGEVTNIQVRPRTPLQNSTCRLGARGALPPAAPCSPRG